MTSFNSIQFFDLVTNKNVWEYYQLYQKTQWLSKEQIEEIKLDKFKKLVAHCYENVPFYREQWIALKIKPFDINTLSSIEQLPVIDKSIVLKNHNKFIPKNLKEFKGVKISKTSGTTGQVLPIYTDNITRSSVWGSFERFYSWMGKTNNDYIFNLKGQHVIKRSFKDYLKNLALAIIEKKYIINAYELDEEKALEYYNWMKKQKHPIILRGYCQNIYDLAQIYKEHNLTLNLKAITTTAEPLLDYQRKLFKEVFECQTFDQYGCGEIGGIAYECDSHEGLHITEERVILEVNKANELILTDLDNYTFPLIRYKNGDNAILTTNECSCGRKSKLIKEILGRTSDNIYGLNGNHLHWGYFHHLFIDSGIAENKNLIKFQIIQKSKSKIEILLVSDDLNLIEKKLLTDEICKVLGNVEITIKNVNNIPLEKSGKHKAIISEFT